MFKTADRVRVLSGFYKDMEGYIEAIEKGQYIVRLENESGLVNTTLPGNRLEVLQETIYIFSATEKESVMSDIKVVLKSIKAIFHADAKIEQRKKDNVHLLTKILSCIDFMEKRTYKS